MIVQRKRSMTNVMKRCNTAKSKQYKNLFICRDDDVFVAGGATPMGSKSMGGGVTGTYEE